MFQLTESSPDRPETGRFYLVTQTSEHGPFETYHDAIDAAEHPHAALYGFNPRRFYYVIDRSEPGEN